VIEATRYEPQFRELDELLLHLKGLVLVRRLLEERGASAAELKQHSDEIERLRNRLARAVRATGGGAFSAAA
jgi:hypothetical protein